MARVRLTLVLFTHAVSNASQAGRARAAAWIYCGLFSDITPRTHSKECLEATELVISSSPAAAISDDPSILFDVHPSWSSILRHIQTILVKGQLLVLPCLEFPVSCSKDAWSAVLKGAAIMQHHLYWAANAASTAAKSAFRTFDQYYLLAGKQPFGWLLVNLNTLQTAAKLGSAAAVLLACVLLALGKTSRKPQTKPQSRSQPAAYHARTSLPRSDDFPEIIPMHLRCPMKLYSKVLLPCGLAHNDTFMRSLANKSLKDITATLREQRISTMTEATYLDAVCSSLSITANDMPGLTSDEIMKEKLLHSTALALLLAWNFPVNNPALVARMQALQGSKGTHKEVVAREYTSHRKEINDELVVALGLPNGSWTKEKKLNKMTVTVPAMVTVARLLSMAV